MGDSDAFPAGTTVHVSFYGKSVKKNTDGSITVKTTSASGGEVEVSIPASLIIPAKTYAVDVKVECNFRGKGKWYGASVIKVREDDTYDVLYDDGDKVSGVRSVRRRFSGQRFTCYCASTERRNCESRFRASVPAMMAGSPSRPSRWASP